MLPRGQSAGLLALAVTVLSCSLWLVAYYWLPVWGGLIRGLMWFGSPVALAAIVIPPLRVESSILNFAILSLAPYPLYGACVGYGWPLASGSIAAVSRALLRRTLAIFLAAAAFGLCMGAWIMGLASS